MRSSSASLHSCRKLLGGGYSNSLTPNASLRLVRFSSESSVPHRPSFGSVLSLSAMPRWPPAFAIASLSRSVTASSSSAAVSSNVIAYGCARRSGRGEFAPFLVVTALCLVYASYTEFTYGQTCTIDPDRQQNSSSKKSESSHLAHIGRGSRGRRVRGRPIRRWRRTSGESSW